MNKNLDIKIIKAYEYLYKYIKSNKFKTKKVNNFIYVHLLYIQNNYNLNFRFKDQTKKKSLYACLKSLYKDLNDKKVKNQLFPDDEMLLQIYLNNEKMKPKKYLQKLQDKIYSNSYVNINIQILDYLGNSEKDNSIINHTLCLIFFMELYPEIPIDKKLLKHVVETLKQMSTIMDKDQVKYTNTFAIFLLIQLKKINSFPDLGTWIENLLKKQLTNGKWSNGFNSFLASSPELLDLTHTALALIVMLEYQVILKHKELIENKKLNNSDKEENLSNKENLNNDNEIIENFEDNINYFYNKKEIMERFDNINKKNKGYYYINFNIYNILLIIITICLIYLLFSLKKSNHQSFFIKHFLQ